MIRNPKRLEWIREMNKLPERPPKIIIGKNVKLHPTSTLGSSGTSFERDEEGRLVLCKQFGDVIIEDNVFIGPHSDVKRASLPGEATIIGSGSVIGAFVNIGHNCRIGSHNFIGNHVCLNGSVEVGDRCWIASHAVIEHQIRIGAGATVGMGSVVIRHVPPGVVVVGVPARMLER